MQLAYWCQQLIVLVLRLEKPRKDFAELVVHHLVTIWLVGWSYAINLTYIGNAVFLTMDVSDVFLAVRHSIPFTHNVFHRGKVINDTVPYLECQTAELYQVREDFHRRSNYLYGDLDIPSTLP